MINHMFTQNYSFFAKVDKGNYDDFDPFESNEENHGYIDVCDGC